MGARISRLLWCCLVFGAGAGGAGAASPPAAAYAELPTAATARMAPDGKSIVLIDGRGDSPTVTVSQIDGTKILPIPTGEWSPNWADWKDNHTLLISLRQTQIADDDTHFSVGQLMTIAADGSRAHPMRFAHRADFGSTEAGSHGLLANIQDDVISDLPGEPNQALIEVGDLIFDYPTVYNADLWDDAKQVLLRPRPGVTGWEADPSGVVRAGYAQSATSRVGVYDYSIIARTADGGDWRNLPFQAAKVAFSATDPTILYARLTPDKGAESVAVIDIPSGTIKRTLITADQGQLTMITDHGAMVGYRDGHETVYIDPVRAADAAAIAAALKTRDVMLVDHSSDGKRITVLVDNPGQPEALWLLDRDQAPTALNPLITDYDDVPPDQIAPVSWTSFAARDGLQIPLLLTLPISRPKAPIAFVVLPHGGPTADDGGGFDWLAQFLASRGYGVLQPQFRGSTGYGKDFENKGKRQWGRAMQDDVTDATRWLISQKLADPKRICIVGASYGGYAALEGAVREPDLYTCAAAFAPVTDLPSLLDEEKNFAFHDLNVPAIGDDTAALAAVSPARHADQIRIPILLIHGNKDFTVSDRQTEEMAAALTAAGKTAQVIYLPEADHYLSRPADRLALLSALEAFLGHNLGPGGT